MAHQGTPNQCGTATLPPNAGGISNPASWQCTSTTACYAANDGDYNDTHCPQPTDYGYYVCGTNPNHYIDPINNLSTMGINCAAGCCMWQNGHPPSTITGDVDYDGHVDIGDLVQIVNLVLYGHRHGAADEGNYGEGQWYQPTLSGVEIAQRYPNADYNGDGNVDILDVMSLMVSLLYEVTLSAEDIQTLEQQQIKIDQFMLKRGKPNQIMTQEIRRTRNQRGNIRPGSRRGNIRPGSRRGNIKPGSRRGGGRY
jgi:hypothetical protein